MILRREGFSLYVHVCIFLSHATKLYILGKSNAINSGLRTGRGPPFPAREAAREILGECEGTLISLKAALPLRLAQPAPAVLEHPVPHRNRAKPGAMAHDYGAERDTACAELHDYGAERWRWVIGSCDYGADWGESGVLGTITVRNEPAARARSSPIAAGRTA